MNHYTVVSGDTLSGIARAANVPLGDLLLANPWLSDANTIYPGWVLHVPVVDTGGGGENPPAEEPGTNEPPAEEPPANEPGTEEPPANEPPATDGGYIIANIDALEMSGVAWDKVVADAHASWGTPNISNQDQDHDIYVLAGGLYYAKTGDAAMRDKVIAALNAAMNTENGGRTLALARNLTGYVLAADLVDYYDPAFTTWVDDVRYENLDGRTLISTHTDRPNNWGTHAGVARLVAALYLNDAAEVEDAVRVFRGFIGDRQAYTGFSYGDTSWQSDPANPVGINPAGATIDGNNVDGVIPDDQRRTGSYSWPAPKGSYPWEAMQGIAMMAKLIERNVDGSVAGWSDSAVLRAFNWLVDVNGNPPGGDDEFIIPVIESLYGDTGVSYSVPVSSGKSVGYTDWLYS